MPSSKLERKPLLAKMLRLVDAENKVAPVCRNPTGLNGGHSELHVTGQSTACESLLGRKLNRIPETRHTSKNVGQPVGQLKGA